MLSWITLLLVALALGLELVFLKVGYFRIIHWESLSILVLACFTAALGYRKKRGFVMASTFLLTVVVTATMAYLTIWAPRLDVQVAAFEKPGVELNLALKTPDGAALRLPEALGTQHALLVFYRGVW